jgi:hypothetical protein
MRELEREIGVELYESGFRIIYSSTISRKFPHRWVLSFVGKLNNFKHNI